MTRTILRVEEFGIGGIRVTPLSVTAGHRGSISSDREKAATLAAGRVAPKMSPRSCAKY